MDDEGLSVREKDHKLVVQLEEDDRRSDRSPDDLGEG